MYNENKIYVTDNLEASEKVQVLIKINAEEFTYTDFHETVTFPHKDYDRYINSCNIYILDSLEDLADFIKGKRDFPKVGDKDEAKVSAEVEVLGNLNRMIDEVFDSEMQIAHNNHCRDINCSNHDYDCRSCFKDYLREVIK